MLTSTILASLLATSATALALPKLLPRQDSTYTTTAIYYQGQPSDVDICGMQQVSTGNVTSGFCNTAYTYSLTVQPLPDRDCQYVLWKGTQSCAVGSSEPSSDFEKYFLPAGGHPVCITTGVYDGGAHIYASGELQCDIDIN